ncbi:MAG TPA: urate oxidase [Acidimicrobiia bacterium]|nr:urate oxidase [Acidimicrobiia bacterium]
MTRLGDNSWGKSAVRLSKVRRGQESHDFHDLSVQVLLTGDVDAAFVQGDNARVLPTDTMRNTVYALAQEHLNDDIEAFAGRLADHFVAKEGIDSATVSMNQRRWQRVGPTGFIGGSSETRAARVERNSEGSTTWGGIDGLVVLKTTDSAFAGYPKDEYTILPETDERLLATSVTAEWRYASVPVDTTATWERLRQALVDGFFTGWSASIQHQGWQMGEAALAAVPEIEEIAFRLPNQHHISFALDRFGMTDEGTVFQPTSEPYGDIRFTVRR